MIDRLIHFYLNTVITKVYKTSLHESIETEVNTVKLH